MNSYTTIHKSASFEYEDRRSIFIGEAAPVATESEALDFIASVKKKYSDANHHVYAYVLRENQVMRFSDDREPQGTAGMPTLDAIRKNGIVDAVVVVVRYFGGTLLGTGGLVRAYSAAAVGALREAEIITYDTYVSYEVSLSYSDYQKIISSIDSSGFRRKDIVYSDAVTLIGSIKKDASQSFEKMLVDSTGGRAKIENCGEKYEF